MAAASRHRRLPRLIPPKLYPEDLRFEIVEGLAALRRRDYFALTLLHTVEFLAEAKAFLRRFSPIPERPLVEKLPYFRLALSRSDRVRFSRRQAFVLSQRAAKGPPADALPPRPKPRFPVRDWLSHHPLLSVILVNTLLVRALFHIRRTRFRW